MNGETFAGWGVIARSPRGSIDVMFGPVFTNETHPAFSGAKASSNNTAEMTAMIEALYFLGPRGSVARHEEACICYDSKHAAGVCLGTTQARSLVQLALACQRSTLCVQHRLRLTVHHVYGHAGNLGNECANHAAALGSLGLISSRNDAARWGRHNFDTNALCEGCNNISDILERLDRARTVATARIQDVRQLTGPSSGFTCLSPLLFVNCVFALSFSFCPCVHSALWRTMESRNSGVSAASSSGENSAHNRWNPMSDLLFHMQFNGVFVPFNDEFDLAKIAFSCHFAFDLLCYKEMASSSGTIA